MARALLLSVPVLVVVGCSGGYVEQPRSVAAYAPSDEGFVADRKYPGPCEETGDLEHYEIFVRMFRKAERYKYDYDKHGRLTSRTHFLEKEKTRTISFQYSQRGNVTKQLFHGSDGAVAEIDYSWNNDDRIVEARTDANGARVVWSWTMNRESFRPQYADLPTDLLAIVPAGAFWNEGLWQELLGSAATQGIQREFHCLVGGESNPIVTLSTEIRTGEATIKMEIAYHYDSSGRLVKTEGISGKAVTLPTYEFMYESRENLVQVKQGDRLYRYTYDVWGNRITEEIDEDGDGIPNLKTKYTYDCWQSAD